MSEQTFVITPKNYPRPLEVLGDHAAVLASGTGQMIHRLKEDVRSWYELHRRNGATNVVVWAIYPEWRAAARLKNITACFRRDIDH